MSFWTFGLGEKGRKLLPWSGAIVSLLSVVSTAYSVFYPLLQQQFGMSTVAPFAIGSSIVGGLGMTLGPLLGGPLLDKFGPKINFLMNTCWYFLAMLCMFQIENNTVWEGGGQIWWILGSCCIGMGAGTSSGTISASVAKWNPDNLGFYVAIDNLGPALAPVWVAPFAAAVIPQVGIGKGFMILMILGMIGYFVFGFLPFSTPPAGWTPPGWKERIAEQKAAQAADGKHNIRLAELGNLFPLTFGEILKTISRNYGFVGCNRPGYFLGLFENCSVVKAKLYLDMLENSVAEYNKKRVEIEVKYSVKFSNSTEEKIYQIRPLIHNASDKMR